MIDANRIQEIVMDCLIGNEEQMPIYAEGIVNTYGFDPVKIKSYRWEVEGMLAQLPNEFMANGGGGWSFLNACMDKDGNQWGEHQNMEQLFCLGMALGLVECQLPREMWEILPGGMPYYVVKLTDMVGS